MAGVLHIFRRSVVNGEPHYQVNYTTAGDSYARVLGSDAELTDFLIETGALAEDEVNGFWDSLAANGHASLSEVDIPQSETAMLGLRQAPSDF